MARNHDNDDDRDPEEIERELRELSARLKNQASDLLKLTEQLSFLVNRSNTEPVLIEESTTAENGVDSEYTENGPTGSSGPANPRPQSGTV